MNLIRLVGCIVVCEGAGMLGSIFTAQSVRTWYVGLTKPSFSPPNWLFAPVWIVLYAMMGIALYIVWEKRTSQEIPASVLIVFFLQLLLNVLWSFVFFGLRSPLWGFVEIAVLWAAILLTMILFWRISRTAGALLMPYLAWVTFASVLTFSIWKLNG
jgi:tryptophan-rich sensory protein